MKTKRDEAIAEWIGFKPKWNCLNFSANPTQLELIKAKLREEGVEYASGHNRKGYFSIVDFDNHTRSKTSESEAFLNAVWEMIKSE